MEVHLRRGSLLVLLLTALLGTPLTARAAAVTAVLQPGGLTITDAPSAITFTTVAASDSASTLDTRFTLGVTDATGSKAGWHIQAVLGSLVCADGTPEPVLSATITNARVTALTGVAPQPAFVYPHPFQAGGDTIFSAAERSGVGKSSLAFDAEVTVPTDAQDVASLNAALMLTVAAGP